MRFASVFILILILGAVLRFIGLTHGDSDFVLPENAATGATRAFYHFHPDERTLIQAGRNLENTFRPPITAYGAVPLYLARFAIGAAAIITGTQADPDALDSRRAAIMAARCVSALVSCITLWLLWPLGRRYFGAETACLAALMMSVAPLAIQQAHFFTVDGQFALLGTASVLVLINAIHSQKRWHYVLCGVLIGLTAAVRLSGLSTWLVLLAGHIWHRSKAHDGRGWRRFISPTAEVEPWLAALAALAVLVILQPYLVADPAQLLLVRNTNDFSFSLKVASGEILRPWSLVDVHTTPFLHYWSHLWPRAAGWPLTITFVAGVGVAVWRHSLAGGLILVWLALQFALIGGLHTKHVRYLLPMLPFHCLLAADLLRVAGGIVSRRWRLAGFAALGGVCAFTVVYGVAFARIYTIEDSRVAAGRWIAASVPAGSTIGVERGGFPVSPCVSRERYHHEPLDLALVFATRGYLNCRATRSYLKSRMTNTGVLVITDVNRYQQFTAVPDLYPAAASFYRELVSGRLGYDVVQRFKVYPSLAGFSFEDDGAEPSFIGYDHPAVIVLRRRAGFEEDWQRWSRSLAAEKSCPDEKLEYAIGLLQAGGAAAARLVLQRLRFSHPEQRYAALIEAETHATMGLKSEQLEALKRFVAGYADQSLGAYLLPWATAMSLIELGSDALAMRALRDGFMKRNSFAANDRRLMANSYVYLANRYEVKGNTGAAATLNKMATAIRPGRPRP